MVFNSVKHKTTIAVLLLLLAASILTGVSILLFGSLLISLILSLTSILILSFIFSIIIKHTVVNKIYQLEKDIDESIDKENFGTIAMSSGDEFQELANRLNTMVTTEQERSRRVKQDLIEEITVSENDKYLQNVNDGLLFVDYGQIISEYYSRSLADIFDRKDIGGQHLSDFLYPDKEESRERRKALEKFIIRLYNDPGLFESITDENNPLHNIWISRDDGKRILVDGSYRKVEDKGTLVQIMIIFKDRTDEGLLEKKLDEKDMRSNFELDSIVSILRSGPGPFLQYIEESHLLLRQFRTDILEIQNPDIIQSSFRAINSMKCSASYFDFKAVEKLCHNLEDILSDFREGDFDRKEALDIIIDDIYSQFDHVKHLISRFQEFLSSEEGKVYETTRNEQEHFFDSLKIMMTRNADYLEKDINFTFSSDYEEFPLINEIKNPVIHLLRNAVDHGIELPSERKKKGKDEKGSIDLSIVKTSEGGAGIIIKDDGGGLDFEELREIAIEKGFIKREENPGRGNLIRAVFSSGFSIRDKINGLSGRGVGLDAVREDISHLGGRITIKTENHIGSRFTILLPPDLF